MSALALEAPVCPTLTEAGARALTERLRSALTEVQELLAAAYVGRVWEPLSHPSWQVYCSVELIGARLKMPREQRREVVAGLRRAGLSTRAIASGIGASDQTVRGDLVATGEVGGQVLGMDGKAYRPTGRRAAAAVPAVEQLPKTAQTCLDLLEAGPDGLTWAELGARRGWHHGTSSGVLSRLHAQGRVVRTRTYRDGSAVYLHPAHQR